MNPTRRNLLKLLAAVPVLGPSVVKLFPAEAGAAAVVAVPKVTVAIQPGSKPQHVRGILEWVIENINTPILPHMEDGSGRIKLLRWAQERDANFLCVWSLWASTDDPLPPSI